MDELHGSREGEGGSASLRAVLGAGVTPLSRGPTAFPSRRLLHLHSVDLRYFWTGWRNKRKGVLPPSSAFQEREAAAHGTSSAPSRLPL